MLKIEIQKSVSVFIHREKQLLWPLTNSLLEAQQKKLQMPLLKFFYFPCSQTKQPQEEPSCSVSIIHFFLAKVGTEGKRNREQLSPHLLMNALSSFPILFSIVSDSFSQQWKSRLMGEKKRTRKNSFLCVNNQLQKSLDHFYEVKIGKSYIQF